ncbi:MAG: hypothetical protein JW864_04540 [Spirochaetes bacterium]|nr:hypothetical protein [Spirochaetota bacterium]
MNRRLIAILSVFLITVLAQFSVKASQKGRPIQSQIEKGTYVEQDILNPETIKWLPIPAGTVDYALYQAINNVSSVVLANFKVGERVITLIQDNNADGNVDAVTHWFIDSNRIDKETVPTAFCPAEKFKELKEIIINAKNSTVNLGGKNFKVSPNSFGLAEMERLLKRSSNVSKYKQGLRIKRTDPDERSLEMLVFSFSYNIQDSTADLAFKVNYYDRGQTRVSPIINFGVYCSNSKDPFAIETVKKIREVNSKYFAE